MNPKVDAYINKISQWKEETEQLREILLDCGLTEELKWSKPAYLYNDSIVVVIQAFKSYFALLFYKGVLLQDPDKLLVRMGDNTKVGRQMRFDNVKDIHTKKKSIKAYIKEAITLEKKGLKVTSQPKAMPKELEQKLATDPTLKKAFESLTPGRQRGYNIYFSQAKQSQTRVARIEKCTPKIMNGKGLNDR